MQFAAMSSMAEIDLGRLAQQRGMSRDVKQFGQRMVADHTKASMQLQEAAGNTPLPKQLDGKHQDAEQMLSKMNGAEFDREYMRMMVDDHREAVARFQAVAGNGDVTATAGNQRSTNTRGTSGSSNTSSESTTSIGAGTTNGANGSNRSGIETFARQTLPTLQDHLRMAEQIQSRLK